MSQLILAQLTLERRFQGPPHSGNGGFACGTLLSLVGTAGEVSLRSPLAIARPLVVRQQGIRASLHDGDTLVAEARAGSPDIDAPPPVDFNDAVSASLSPHIAADQHPIPNCFVCGPARESGDGMRLFAGAVRGSDSLSAVPWTPDLRFPHDQGCTSAAMVCAALDCPSGYAAHARYPEPMLLGTMAVRIERLPRLNERCVVTTRLGGRERRKVFVDTALYGANEERLAGSRNTWILVSRDVQLGAA